MQFYIWKANHVVAELQALDFLLSHGVPRDTAEYAIKVAQGKGEKDTDCSDPTYIIMEWCAMPNAFSGQPDPNSIYSTFHVLACFFHMAAYAN